MFNTPADGVALPLLPSYVVEEEEPVIVMVLPDPEVVTLPAPTTLSTPPLGMAVPEFST
jgi:hypothetical protein